MNVCKKCGGCSGNYEFCEKCCGCGDMPCGGFGTGECTVIAKYLGGTVSMSYEFKLDYGPPIDYLGPHIPLPTNISDCFKGSDSPFRL